MQKKALFHLLTAAKHTLFLQLEHTDDSQAKVHKNSHKAICDSQGYIHQVQTSFIDLLERYYINNSESKNSLLKLPFTLDVSKQAYEVDALQVELKPFSDS